MTAYIDTHALKSITALQRPGKPNLLERVVDLFKSESPKALASMCEALDDSDLKAVRNAAHSLKSSSAYVGAMLLSQRCRELESAAREENYTACIVLGDGLDELFTASCGELDAYMATNA